MLSRAAERIYWAGRYLERAENTARIVQQYSQLLLDLPQEADVGWHELVAIFGAKEVFEAAGSGNDERAIFEFLVADAASTSSLRFCIAAARDNIRNLRDLLPQESWESANELNQYARRSLASSTSSEDRFEVLSECIGRCQQINGILIGTMSHTTPFHFLALGQSIERADMTTRVIDVAASYLQRNERVVLRYGSTLWTNVLKSVSAFQMYRQYRQPQVQGLGVIDFLLNDRYFPRAARACVDTAIATAQSLPRADDLVLTLERTRDALPASLPDDLDGAAVSELMDALQERLGEAHAAVVDTWFLPGTPE